MSLALSRLQLLRSHLGRSHLGNSDAFALGSKATRTARAAMSTHGNIGVVEAGKGLTINSTVTMKSGHEIPVLGFGVSFHKVMLKNIDLWSNTLHKRFKSSLRSAEKAPTEECPAPRSPTSPTTILLCPICGLIIPCVRSVPTIVSSGASYFHVSFVAAVELF